MTHPDTPAYDYRHIVQVGYSPADALDTAAFAWFCSCGDRGEWIHSDLALYDQGESDYADEQASVAAILDSRHHGAYPEATVVNSAAGTVSAAGLVWSVTN